VVSTNASTPISNHLAFNTVSPAYIPTNKMVSQNVNTGTLSRSVLLF
jgi:hypothetical protein